MRRFLMFLCPVLSLAMLADCSRVAQSNSSLLPTVPQKTSATGAPSRTIHPLYTVGGEQTDGGCAAGLIWNGTDCVTMVVGCGGYCSTPGNVFGQIDPTGGTDGTPSGGGGTGGGGAGCDPATYQCVASNLPGSPFGAAIAQAAKNLEGTSSKGIPGTDNGRVACGYWVNIVFQNVLKKTYAMPPPGSTRAGNTNWVPDIVRALNVSPCFIEFTDATQAMPGDIVVENGNGPNPDSLSSNSQAHIGICMQPGCSEIDSNSTGQQEFMNNFHNNPNMDGTGSTFYRYFCSSLPS